MYKKEKNFVILDQDSNNKPFSECTHGFSLYPNVVQLNRKFVRTHQKTGHTASGHREGCDIVPAA